MATQQDQPTIIIDDREKTPLFFPSFPSKSARLISGDYSIAGSELDFTVERKTLNDLVSSLTQNRDRFTREMERLRGYRFKRLLVIGTEEQIAKGEYFSKANPKAILGSLRTFEARYDVPVTFEPTPARAARRVEIWVHYYCRELRLKAGLPPLPFPPSSSSPKPELSKTES